MTPNSAASTYRESVFENAPPLKLVRMLYLGALRFLKRASLAAVDDAAEFNGCLQRADAIVSELRCSLDHEQGGEVAAQLDALYAFVSEQIAQALLERTKEPIANAERVLETLADAWSQVQTATAAATAAAPRAA